MSNLLNFIAMKTLFPKNPGWIHTRDGDIAKNEPYADRRDYYCEGQEPRADMPEERTTVRGDNHAGVKNKKQNFFACYNMCF